MPIKNDKLVVADARGRINLGLDSAGKAYLVNRDDCGDVNLVSMAMIPEREMWLWKNPEARASFDKAVREIEAGEGIEVDFSAPEYAEIELT